jgi:hypothetical protein
VKPPLHVFHIGKTGGTALKDALVEHRDAAGYDLLTHGHTVTLADVPVGEKYMFVLREPLSRFVSAFNGRLREDRPRYHYPWNEQERIAFSLFKTPDALATALSSRNRRTRHEAREAMRGIGHVNTSYAYWFGSEKAFRRRLPDLFFIGFTDRLDEDFELLKPRLGLPPDARLPHDETVAHRTPAGFDSGLSDLGRRNLERWYRWDVRFYRLCRELAHQADQPPSATRLDPVT